MKNLKKVLALVMAFAMAFTMMAGAAFTDSADIEATEAVDTLTALGVINGYEDGSFKPNGTVTRAEMAAMIYIVRNGGKTDASGYKNAPTSFTDINGHWAEGYIKHAQTMGIISGRSDKIFDPNAKVTGVEAALMCLRTMGYDAEKAGIGGATWASKTLSLANEKSLLDEVRTDLYGACPRQYAAQLIYNMLDTEWVVWSNDIDDFKAGKTTTSSVYDEEDKKFYTVSSDETVGAKYMGLDKVETTLTSVEKEDNKDTYRLNGVFTKVEKDYSNLMGQKVNVLRKDGKNDKIYGVYAIEDSKVLVEDIVGNIDDLDKILAGQVKEGADVKVDGVEYKTEDITGYWFNVAKAIADVAEVKDEGKNIVSYNFKAIDNDDDNKIDTLVITPASVEKITYANKTGVRVGAKEYKFEDDTIFEGAAKDDWAVITDKKYTVDDKNVLVKADVVSGKITSVKKESGNVTEVRVDGTWYKNLSATTNSSTGDKVDLVVYNGYYFDVDGSTTSLEVAVVTGVGNYDKMDDVTEVKLMFKDGKEEIVDVEKWDDVENDVSNHKGTKLVSYEIDDDKYTLTSVKDNTKIADTDYTAQIDSTATYDKDRATVKMDNFEYDIDEAAFVVINNTDDSKYTCMTGAELLKRNDIEFSWTTLAVDDGTVGAMFAQTTSTVTSGDTLYGYIVDSYTALNADDKEKLYIDVIVDGEKLEDVETDKKVSTNKGWEAGTAISYTMDGDVMSITEETMNATAAIKEFNDSRVLLYKDATDEDSATVRRLLTEDTVIIAIDSDDNDNVLYAGNSLVAANKAFDEDGNFEKYYKNATYKYDTTNDEIEVIFVEVAADEEF